VSVALSRVVTLREMGRDADAARVAEDALRREGSWLPDPRAEDFAIAKEANPLLLDTLVDTNRITRAERARRRDAWLADWKKRVRPFHEPFLWLNGYAAVVHDLEGAREAMAAMPKDGVPPVYPRATPDEGLGRMYLLLDQPAEARRILARWAHGCDGLSYPISYVRSRIWLGEALERMGERDGACKEYASVIERWGHAKPRSVSAENARAHARKLDCPEK